MTLPITWQVPASFPTYSELGTGSNAQSRATVGYANGYWFYMTGSGDFGNLSSGRVGMAVATDPTDVWTAVEQPIAPVAGNTLSFNRIRWTPQFPVQYDGTYYFYGSTQARSTDERAVITYATDPYGPWTAVDAAPVISGLDDSVFNLPRRIIGIRYTNGRWIAFGVQWWATASSSIGGWLAYSDTGLFGSWTMVYNASLGLPAGTPWNVEDCLYLDGYYHLPAWNNGSGKHFMYSSSATLDSWTENTNSHGLSSTTCAGYYVSTEGDLFLRETGNTRRLRRNTALPGGTWETIANSSESANWVDKVPIPGLGTDEWVKVTGDYSFTTGGNSSKLSLIAPTSDFYQFSTDYGRSIATDGTTTVKAKSIENSYVFGTPRVVYLKAIPVIPVEETPRIEVRQPSLLARLLAALRLSGRNDNVGNTANTPRFGGNNDQSTAASTSHRIFGSGQNTYDPP